MKKKLVSVLLAGVMTVECWQDVAAPKEKVQENPKIMI